jgi:small subunit ribosomal protein S7
MRRPVKNRNIAKPDIKHSNPLVGKFVNYIMKEGKKAVALKIVYSAFDILEEKTKKPAIDIFMQALENAGPTVELRSRRVGGANYQVPVEVRPERRTALAMRWILDAARSGKGKPMHLKLSEELLNAANNTGTAIKKRADVHRMADANKAFAHFAW